MCHPDTVQTNILYLVHPAAGSWRSVLPSWCTWRYQCRCPAECWFPDPDPPHANPLPAAPHSCTASVAFASEKHNTCGSVSVVVRVNISGTVHNTFKPQHLKALQLAVAQCLT